jgi:hypothetical protein
MPRGNIPRSRGDIGAHMLNLWKLEPGVVFQKIVVDLEVVRPSYLGPPESTKQFAR